MEAIGVSGMTRLQFGFLGSKSGMNENESSKPEGLETEIPLRPFFEPQ